MEAKHQSGLEEIIQMITHEIRNPLAAIALANRTLAEVINGGIPGDTDIQAYTDIIARNVDRVEKLLRELMHTTTGEQPFASLDICQVIDNALAKAEDRLFLQNMDVNKSYSNACYIRGNEEKLSLAFLNIIINAVESVKHDNGRIWIVVFQINDEVKVIVKDNGSGMEPMIAGRIFEPGFSNKPHGLGMGLANVNSILTMHRASISVNTEPGKGTSFIITFPATAAPAS